MSKRRTKFHKARVVKQTQFDKKLMRVEELVREFHDLLAEASQSPEDHESIQTKLSAIGSRHFPEAVYSLQLAMKLAQRRAFRMEANRP